MLYVRAATAYHDIMTENQTGRGDLAPWQRWGLLEERFGTLVRASDTAWAKTLTPADRVSIVEDLFGAAYAAHARAGDWNVVDDLAWHETLAERRRLAAAFHRFDEVQRGCTPLADAG